MRSDGDVVATATSDRGADHSFADFGHPPGVWRRVVLPTVTGSFDHINFSVADDDDGRCSESRFAVDDLLVAAA